jgi:MATE family multidrug resistance protein
MQEKGLSIRYQDLLKVSLPMSLGAFVQFFVVFTDNYFAAQLDGKAMSGVSYIGLAYITLAMITTGIASAIQIIVARRMGEQQWSIIPSVVNNGLFLGLVIALIQFIALYFLGPIFIESFIIDPEIKNYMHEFSSIRSWGFWIYTPTMLLQAYWTGVAKTKVVFSTMLITSISNMVLAYVLIFGKGPFAPMGVSGAAWATLSAECLAFVFLFGYTWLKNPVVIKQLTQPIFSYSKSILQLGTPIVLQLLIALGVWLAFYTMVESRGPQSIQSAFIVRNMYMLAWVSVMGFSSAMRTYTSALIAENRIPDLKKLFFKIASFNFIGVLILSHGLWLYPDWISQQFTQDPTTIRYTVDTMKLIVPAMLIYSFTSILLAWVEGSGATVAGFWIEVVTSFIYIISIYIMVHYTQWEVSLLWLSDYVYFIVMGVCSGLYLIYGQWRLNKL